MYQIIPVEPFNFILFGATGDLAKKEIFPSLFSRFVVGQMTEQVRIVAVARKPIPNEEFRRAVKKSICSRFCEQEIDNKTLHRFLQLVSYTALNSSSEESWKNLRSLLKTDWLSTFYLSVGPSVFPQLIDGLSEFDLIDERTRIVVEKPFGHDAPSAKTLNQLLSSVFNEKQIYRIDHYLGKETVQNLMALRFANILFEPLWNSQFIDHIQITVAESIGVEGRGGYYDTSGAMRDMVQNHLMQLLCLVAMEPPSTFSPDSVRDEKLKVIRSIEVPDANDIVLGQYKGDKKVKSFHEDIENPVSTTESFVAMKCSIANWRWAGVPFYIRTGKRLSARLTEIAVVFKNLPHLIFEQPPSIDFYNNVLIIRVQPQEGIDLRVTIKEPGPGGMRLVQVPLNMSFDQSLLEKDFGKLTNAYERLIMDVVRGDQTLFMRGDEVETAWEWTDKAISNWKENQNAQFPYSPLSDGPSEANALIKRDNRSWMQIT